MAESGVKWPPKKATAAKIVSDLNLSSKYIIVTGANTGIGFETGRVLALKGGHVVMACRNVTAANDAKAKILQEKVSATFLIRQMSDAEVSVMKLDLSSLKSVEEFADEYLKLNIPLHYLILNAGVLSPPTATTTDGFQTTFQVNHLSHFYLSQLLKEKLIQSAPARVVVLSSEAHRQVRWSPSQFTWDNLSPKNEGGGGLKAYGISKMCNVLFARELDKQLKPQSVTAYSLHPGVVKTDVARNAAALRLIFKMPFTKNIDTGASTSVFCTVADGLESYSGNYFDGCRVKETNDPGKNMEAATTLWTISQQMIDHYKKSAS